MADASLNHRTTVRLADGVAFAQIGIVGLDGQIELEALRLYGLPEAAPTLLTGTPTLPVGQREFAAETALDLPSLAPGAAHLVDVTVPGAKQGDRAEASLASATPSPSRRSASSGWTGRSGWRRCGSTAYRRRRRRCSGALLVANVVGRPGRRGNLYPSKQRPEQKIDAAVAPMMAVGRDMSAYGGKPDISDFFRAPLFA